jgi:hypothetical protein
MRTIEVATVVVGLSALVAGAARADDGALWGRPGARGPGLWQVALGVRDSSFRDAGYDPFSENDAFVQASLTGTRAFRTGGPFTPAVGVSWETGAADAPARAGQAHLRLSRLAAVLDGRLALLARFSAFLRLSPGLLQGTASLDDASAPATLRTSFSRLSLDASAGAVAAVTPPTKPLVLLVIAEGGYGWSPRQTLTLTPQLAAADQQKGGSTSLGSFAPRGAFLRLSVGLAF